MFSSFRLLFVSCFVVMLALLGFGIVSAQDDTPEIPVVEIETSAGLVNLVEVVLDDRYPFGCNPTVNYSCFAVAPSGYEILFLFLSDDPGVVLNQGIYVTVPGSNSRHDLEMGGVDSGRGLVAFAVPDRADNFVLHWPGNDPLPLDDDEDGVWIYEDACPDEEGVAVANGCPDPDSDGDEVSDSRDNCPDVVGSVGADGCPDADEDTVADADDTCPDEVGSPNTAGCPDSDNDRVADSEDNCPDDRNTSQADFNDDGTGDVCQDSDEDTVLDSEDNCPEEIGTLEGCPDTDEDSVGDANDTCPNEAGSRTADGCPDADEDTIADSEDNCLDDRNPAQSDFNADGTGDACQDSDEDSFMDNADNCPEEAGTLEGCLDTDADEVADADDACPNEAGSLTANGCPDADGDTTADAEDNCPDDRNNNQADFNNDNIGDICQDSDEDSFMDAEDNCPEEVGTLEGCLDTDADEVADADDACPNEAGLPEMNGCLFTAVVIAGSGNVNLREGPGTGFAIVGTASPDDELQILGRNEEGDWLRVRILPEEEDGDVIEAWIAVWLVETDATIEDLPIIEP